MIRRRGRKLQPGLDGTTMALDWRQRAMIVGVPKSARDVLGQLESRATSESGYAERVAEAVKGLDHDPALLTFGLLHTPEHTLKEVAVVVGAVRLLLLDATQGHLYAEFPWSTLCRFDMRHSRGFQTVGLAWYDGEPDISERMRRGTPLELSEMRFAYIYMHANNEVLAAVKVAFDSAAIPEEIHRRPPLL